MLPQTGFTQAGGEMEDGERRRRPERSATVTNGRALGLFRGIAAVPVRHEPGTSEGDDPQPPPTAPRTRSPRLRRRACAARSGRAAAGGAAATGSPWPLCPLPCWDEGVTSAAGPGRGISPRGRPPPGVEVKRCRQPPPHHSQAAPAPLNCCGGHRRIRRRPALLARLEPIRFQA